jgi:NAD+ synthase
MNIQTQIVTWIQNYLNKHQLKSLVVGVSGGIDSAVVSALCAQTGVPVYAVSMPIRQNVVENLRAQAHISWLTDRYPNVTGLYINLTDTFDSFSKEVEQSLGSEFTSNLAFANSRSRFRMITLYQIAQSKQGIVVGTGNRVEDFGVGFYTKWGDGGVDISPIGDLYKSEVYALARELGLNQGIIDAAPTDGLWDDGRTDGDQLCASYDELEWAMENPNPQNPTPRQQEVLTIYNRFHTANQHKMQPIPVCIIEKDK